MLSCEQAEELIKKNEALAKENLELLDRFERAMRMIDRTQVTYEERMETAAKMMAGVVLKSSKRRKVVVKDADIRSFNPDEMELKSVEGGIEYNFTGSFE